MISSSVIILMVLSAFFALLVSWALLMPFFKEEETVLDTPKSNNLGGKKEKIMMALEDLEMDYLAMRLTEEDYLSEKRSLLEEAEACLAEPERN